MKYQLMFALFVSDYMLQALQIRMPMPLMTNVDTIRYVISTNISLYIIREN